MFRKDSISVIAAAVFAALSTAAVAQTARQETGASQAAQTNPTQIVSPSAATGVQSGADWWAGVTPRSVRLAHLARCGADWVRAHDGANLVGRVKRSPLVHKALYSPIDRTTKLNSPIWINPMPESTAVRGR